MNNIYVTTNKEFNINNNIKPNPQAIDIKLKSILSDPYVSQEFRNIDKTVVVAVFLSILSLQQNRKYE